MLACDEACAQATATHGFHLRRSAAEGAHSDDASRAGLLPDDPGWAYEVKFDGIRAQLRWDGRSICLRSRPGRDCTEAFPELAPLGEVLGQRRLLLDGERLDAEGRPDFTSLRGRLRSHGRTALTAAVASPATLLAFDLLHLDGRSTRALPYLARRERLRELGLECRLLRAPRDFRDDATALPKATREQGLEGVVAKRLDAPYEPGRRGERLSRERREPPPRRSGTGAQTPPVEARY